MLSLRDSAFPDIYASNPHNRAAGRIRYRREIYYSIFFAVFQGGTKTKLHNFYRFSELILDAEFNLYIS